MVAVKEKAPQEEKIASSALVAARTAGVPADLASEMEGMEGLGTSGKADDNIVPFLSHLQDLSPEVKKRDPLYIEGAEPGCLLNKATRQVWKIDQQSKLLVDDDGQPLTVQPCEYQHLIVEWIPRDAGGGFVSRHDKTEETVEATMLKIGGKQIPDPRDSSGKKKIWRLGSNDLIDTRYHFVNVLQPDGRVEPCVMSFTSTGHTASRSWMSLMRNNLLQGKIPPSWFRQYHVKALTKSNAQGEWFVLSFEDAGWVQDKAVRARGLALHQSVSSGVVKAAAETDSTGGGADIPI